jgi:hypothetical protein
LISIEGSNDGMGLHSIWLLAISKPLLNF